MKLELRSPVSSFASRHAGLRFSGTFALLAALGAAGCGGDDDAGEDTTAAVELVDANNYTSNASLNIQSVETAPAVDLDICWSDVDQDLQCHAVDALNDVDNVGLVRFQHLSESDLEAKLVAGELPMSDVAGYISYKTGNSSTCTKLSKLTLYGTPVRLEDQYVEDADTTYMLLFTKGVEPGVGARTMTIVKPTSASTNTQVMAPSGCGMLDFSADLSSLTPAKLPANGPWNLNWKKATRDSLGNPIKVQTISSVLVGYFEGMTVAELESKLMDMELLATDIWETKLDNPRAASVDLAKAVHRKTGDSFTGFDRKDGVWALALMCATCQNPAPVLLTVVDTEEAE
jgi:hypothetical protein